MLVPIGARPKDTGSRDVDPLDSAPGETRADAPEGEFTLLRIRAAQQFVQMSGFEIDTDRLPS